MAQVTFDERIKICMAAEVAAGFTVQRRVTDTNSLPVRAVRYSMEDYTVVPQVSSLLPQIKADPNVNYLGEINSGTTFAKATPGAKVGDLYLLGLDFPRDAPGPNKQDSLDYPRTYPMAGDGVMLTCRDWGADSCLRSEWVNVGPILSTYMSSAPPKVVSAVVAPLSVTCEFSAGSGSYALSQPHDPGDVVFECDARFVAEDATGVNELTWPARHGNDPFTLVSPPGLAPVTLKDTDYTFYNTVTRRWVKNAAVQFNDVTFAKSEGNAWTYRAADNPRDNPDTGFGMLGVWCLNNVSSYQNVPIMGFSGVGTDVGLYLDRSDLLVLKIDEQLAKPHDIGVESGIRIPADWFDRPIVLYLAHYPARSKNFQITVVGSKKTTTWSASVPTGTMQLWSSDLQLCWGNNEYSFELLDLAVWRDGIDDAQVLRALGAYAGLYGVWA